MAKLSASMMATDFDADPDLAFHFDADRRIRRSESMLIRIHNNDNSSPVTYMAVVELIRTLKHIIFRAEKNFELLSVNYLELQYTVYGIRQSDADLKHWTRI